MDVAIYLVHIGHKVVCSVAPSSYNVAFQVGLNNDCHYTRKTRNDPASVLEVQAGSGAVPAVFEAGRAFADAGTDDCWEVCMVGHKLDEQGGQNVVAVVEGLEVVRNLVEVGNAAADNAEMQLDQA